MIRVSDFIFKHLVEVHHIHHCFLVTGGGAMYLDDSIGHTKGLKYICNHHEQAAAIAGEGYYRASGHLSVTCVTTGPGGTNAITGVLGQWLDSIPGLYISGQVKQSTTIVSCPELNLRQLGDQEADIKRMVRPITKYCVTITDIKDVKYELDKAIYISLNGRPGPVWIDVPLDIQGAMVSEDEMRNFDPIEFNEDSIDHSKIDFQIEDLLYRITKAKSPVIYVGNGIRLAHRVDEFISLAESLQIPVVTAISGSDIIWYDHPLFYGRPGICGDRIGNIMVQNSDLLIILGTRLSIRQISYAYDLFAPKAYKVMVDVDASEMDKPTLSIDMKLHSGLSEFVDKFIDSAKTFKTPGFAEWRSWGRMIESKLPTLFEDNPDYEGYTNSYKFVDELFSQLYSGDVVVTGNGTAYTCTYQAMKVKKGVRVFANQGCAAMGYGLPAAIGACISNSNGRTICITGDGSIQMNLQELQTLVTYQLPLKLFILENESYLAIKTTQKSFFDGHYMGSNPSSGVICPDMKKVAEAYGIPFIRVSDNESLVSSIQKTLNYRGAMICEIKMHPEQTLFPKSASFKDEKTGKMSSAPLEKMAPFLNNELQEECIYES